VGLSEEEEVRRGLLAGFSLFFGVGVFAYLELPEPWDVRIGPEPPECDLLAQEVLEDGGRWVLKGKLKTFLVNDETGHPYLLCVEVRTAKDSSEAEKAMEKKLKKLTGRSRAEVLHEGQISVSGHKARYLVLISKEKGLFRRKERIRYLIEMSFFCDKTGRLISVELVGGPWLLEDEEELISILSSLSCHEVKLPEE